MRIGPRPPSDLELCLFLGIVGLAMLGMIVGVVHAYLEVKGYL